MSEPLRVGVLASGSGTNLQALLDRVHGRGAEIVLVGSDKPGCRALERAEAARVPTATFPRDAHPDRPARDAAMADALDAAGVQLVVLAGYMAILDAAFVQRFAGRLVNVHPSLLPAFPGIRAIEQALDYGVTVFGVTVHLVDEGVDTARSCANARSSCRTRARPTRSTRRCGRTSTSCSPRPSSPSPPARSDPTPATRDAG